MNYDRVGLSFEPFSFCYVTGEVFLIDERLFNLFYWLPGYGVGGLVGRRGAYIVLGGALLDFIRERRAREGSGNCIAGLGGWL